MYTGLMVKFHDYYVGDGLYNMCLWTC